MPKEETNKMPKEETQKMPKEETQKMPKEEEIKMQIDTTHSDKNHFNQQKEEIRSPLSTELTSTTKTEKIIINDKTPIITEIPVDKTNLAKKHNLSTPAISNNPKEKINQETLKKPIQQFKHRN